MAKSDAIKVAEIEERKALVNELFGLTRAIVANPITLGVAGFYLSDRLQGQYYYSEPVLREYQGKQAWITEKQWDPIGGKLNRGAAVALQTGLIAYLGSEAAKGVVGLLKP